MANDISETQAAAGLADADRMLDTVRKFQDGRRNVGALRGMFGVPSTGVKAVEETVEKAAQNFQAPKPKLSPPTP